MTFYTDRYYSSGIHAEFSAPVFKKSPINKILIPHSKDAVCYYSVSLVHNIYTPEKIFTTRVPILDHPYVSYLLLGSSKQAYNKKRRSMHYSELQIGVMGPISGGEYLQTRLHENISFADPAEGWDSQIQNDLCIQYTAIFEKGVIALPWFETNAFFGGRIGVPHTDANVGAYMRWGIFDDYFQGKAVDGQSDFQIWFYLSGQLYLVNYNASLQGGTYNQDNVHILYSINKYLYHLKFGGAAVYKSFKLEVSQEVRSPEFPTSLWNRWAQLKISCRF